VNPLWIRQVRAVLGLELRKTLLSGRAVPLYVLTLAPVILVGLSLAVSLILGTDDLPEISQASLFYAGLFQIIFRFLLYLGCVWTFMNLFRGDILDRSLHYYFLSPIRREVLVAGKFISGLAATSILFVGCVVSCMVLMYGYYGVSAAAGYLLSGQGLLHLLSYVLITIMACLGYGAVFMVIGLFFRNPIVPAVMIWFWEGANPFLPVLLKKFSVVFYLQAMLPVQLPGNAFEVIAEPVPIWLAIPGFLLFTALTLVIAGFQIRRMEIAYASE
jgi:ABC-type transport system involved in multi-copper enzyme maturation permease subunit